MGHFYNPPPSTQGPVASTLPIPHDPIPAQGDPPPRRQRLAVVAMVAVLASWPADLEPVLQRPNNTQQKIAPLTLPYGQPPTPAGPLSVVEYGQLVASWPPDLEPRLGRPNERQQTIAPLTLTYGSQPSPQPALSPLELHAIVSAWAVTWDAQAAPKNAAWNIPPLITSPPYTSLPRQILTAWDPPWLAPPPPVAIAPLTLPTGNQPIPQAPLATLKLAQLVSTWAEAPSVPGPRPSAATISPPIVTFVPYTRPPYGIVALCDPPDHLELVASFVLAPANPDQPPRQFALSPTVLATITAAWVDPAPAPPRPVVSAALLPPPPIPPPTQPPLSVSALTQIVGTWAETWGAQTAPKSAAWTVPPILSAVAYAPLPKLIWTAWEPAWLQPPTPVALAPLTLQTGTPPPPTRAVLERVAAVVAWTPDVPAPLPLRPTAGWNVPLLVAAVPYTTLPLAIRTAWDDAFLLPPRVTPIAPLTLVSGDAPPLRAPIPTGLLHLIGGTWEPPPPLPQTVRGGPVVQPGLVVVVPRVVAFVSSVGATAFITTRGGVTFVTTDT
jgi:hypothetical protein